MSDYTIIIPLFNKEKTIVRAIESILRQDYVVSRIIIVNDCCTDNSLQVLSDYLNKQDNIITKIDIIKLTRNSGPGAARNAGIELVPSGYIGFLDADDYYLHDYFSKVDFVISKYSAQIVICRRQYLNKQRIVPRTSRMKPYLSVLKGDDGAVFKLMEWEACFFKEDFMGGSGNMVIHRDVIADFRFPERDRLFEDWCFFINILRNQDEIYYLDRVLHIIDNSEKGISSKYIQYSDYISPPSFLSYNSMISQKMEKHIYMAWVYNCFRRLRFIDRFKFIKKRWKDILMHIYIGKYTPAAIFALLKP